MDNTRSGGDALEPYDDDPASHLDRLLARARNAADLDQTLLRRLRTALMHCVDLHSMRFCKGPTRTRGHRTVKHVFLLADGSSETLWEIEDDTGTDGEVVRELHTAQESVEARLRERFGDSVFPEFDFGKERLIAEVHFDVGRDGPRGEAGLADARHEYAQDNSADHAWRVLRRAENGDRPGEPVRQRLRSAVAHETTLVTMRHTRVEGVIAEWALYEHAFLLADGGKLSLWELEHTITPGGHPICEVYLDEMAARVSADRREAR
ncbi:DUF6227 family protein [Streptantibioticus ferralitis]|uniref:DUF6227 family protein n=1 Tax=Streptantibioticus ferralitis TaxID=236510 RepID=A0ABT5ZBB5_9ACTN|nr:DUF6227 family protein [Streptantibioticus ferralitis]MDF2260973.1 DUF6227 family protein [Streptantibioticus ferralitis]